MSFDDLGVPDDLIDALRSEGIDAPFPIQAATIPPALEGRDVSGRAPTGSGKTLAFGIPLVANVERARPKRPRALVLVPTRELAAQVTRDLDWLGANRDVRVHAFYGGTKFEPQIKALRQGVDIAVACPGRLADLVNQGIARLDGVDLVVIDEADRMADMGFLPEVRRLVDQTDGNRQTLLFSATLDGDVDELVRRYQHDPAVVDVTPEVDATQLEHHFWAVPHAKRVEVTAAVIQRVGPTVVFTRTRYGADRVAKQLAHAGVEAVAIHGSRTQNQRDRALQAFRTGHAQALVATDVAARGIHVDDVTCVVHFDLPLDPKDYVHRSGRTGRAGATGVVVALAMPDRRKDTKKLLRELHLGVTVTDPDVESLPEGDPITPTRPARQNRDRGERRDRRDRPGRPSGHGGGHKPSGRRAKPPVDSPSKTKAGRAKTSTGRSWSSDGDRDRGDRRPSGAGAGGGWNGTTRKKPKSAGGSGPSGRFEDRPRTKARRSDGQNHWSGGRRRDDDRSDSRSNRSRAATNRPEVDEDGSWWPDDTRPSGRKRSASKARGSRPGGPKARGPKAGGPKGRGRKPGSAGPGGTRSGGPKAGGPKRSGKPGARRNGGANTGPSGKKPARPKRNPGVPHRKHRGKGGTTPGHPG